MEHILIDVTSKKESIFLRQLAKRMGYKSRILKIDELEDIAIGKAIKEGRKNEYVDRETVMNALRN
ncbi:MAG: hypothetical protein A2275_10100 [Bacteroidetes bacterium RIFOXYA12_FULL_35_11]|nr:MAG: hypothetical protein A2X01_07550 [Bacteroidetes bacterium GWF2_35_48]OFY73691.1 MAG: hypothetical protein A2275_10100 [Bacteroidetes bacterium RIFOXYA12_FULL_35_11]OFY96714.1 MAG: hypothetical protein A2309_07550 [Bacteroidetes bacterium RIFOXYB2_FULL_35_7]OFZ04231.1 MAG: hypothetical protein A2491_19895 [Bacteroidetes bacterium RIFOXYC12_FULL_35_7]HBX52909.1 hypothetical protein [Bacteroidales bacterium]